MSKILSPQNELNNLDQFFLRTRAKPVNENKVKPNSQNGTYNTNIYI